MKKQSFEYSMETIFNLVRFGQSMKCSKENVTIYTSPEYQKALGISRKVAHLLTEALGQRTKKGYLAALRHALEVYRAEEQGIIVI